jgi:phosphoserine phosphatase RsbU/P
MARELSEAKEPRRLLLVEDSSTMRRILCTMLKDEGFEVETANDGLQGLAKARLEPRPELILSDYEMPEMDGAGLCKALKADVELRSMPVLMLTTLGEAHNAVAGLAAGADDYIEKLSGPVRAHPRTPAHRRPEPRGCRAQPAAGNGA